MTCSLSADAAARRKTKWRPGHVATKAFLVNALQNQGRLITIPANTSMAIVTTGYSRRHRRLQHFAVARIVGWRKRPPDAGAPNRTDGSAVPAPSSTLLEGAHKHARGIYPIPEFHYATQWNVNDEYLELPIGHIPLPNDLQGQALAGDYGVLQSFVVTVQNPNGSPAIDRDLRKSAWRTCYRNVSDRWRLSTVASNAGVFALQNPAIRRTGAWLRARDDRYHARGRIELSAQIRFLLPTTGASHPAHRVPQPSSFPKSRCSTPRRRAFPWRRRRRATRIVRSRSRAHSQRSRHTRRERRP